MIKPWNFFPLISCSFNTLLYTCLFTHTQFNSSHAISWSRHRLVEEWFNSVRTSRRTGVGEFDTRVGISPPSAMLMEAADRPCQAWIPAITLRHCFSNSVYAFGVCKSLVVENLTRFRYAKNSNLSSCNHQYSLHSMRWIHILLD